MGWQAENIMVGCVQCMLQCGRKNITDWLDRNKGRHRKALSRIQERYQMPDGKRSLTRLIDLTVSELEACIWVDEFWVGALPFVKERQHRMTDARKAVLVAAREKSEEAQKARRAEIEAARVDLG